MVYKFLILLVLFIAFFFVNLLFKPSFYIKDYARECKVESVILTRGSLTKERECICFGNLAAGKKTKDEDTKFYCDGFGFSYELTKRDNSQIEEIENLK